MGGWVNNQRSAFKENKLSDERKEMLNSVGFVWTVDSRYDMKWKSMFDELKQYKSVHSHCNVPQREGSSGKWVNNQRSAFKENKLSDERKEMGSS